MSAKADAMQQTITFQCPLPPVGLRRNHETRSHAYKAKLKDEYSEAVWCAGWAAALVAERNQGSGPPPLGVMRQQPPWQRARLTLVWKHHRVGPDEDNALASCKALIDCLTTKGRRPLGIVVDDAPEHLSVSLTTQKVRTKAEECVAVTIQRSDV